MRSQFGIEAIFSYFLVAISVIAVLIIIHAPFTGLNSNKEKAIEKLEGKELSAQNTRDLQLTAYLRTELPSDLPDVIRNFKGTNLAYQLSPAETANFLDSHPSLYKGKTYGDFIRELYYEQDGMNTVISYEIKAAQFDVITKVRIEKDRRQHIFAAVTRAAFAEQRPQKYGLAYPNISASYGTFKDANYKGQQLSMPDGKTAIVEIYGAR